MIKAVRVVLPIDKPKETIELCDFIIAKHTLDGAGSPLTGIIDMTAFGNLTTDAKNKRKQADIKDRSAQGKYNSASVNVGTGPGQRKDVKDTVLWYIRQIKDLLLIIHNGVEESISDYGFNVVITQIGSRKHVRVTIPKKTVQIVELAEAIIEHHTTLGAGSPLTAALVDMTAFGTLVSDTAALLSEWVVLRGQVQALNNDALTTIGYAPGQTSTTLGTLYNMLTKIRTRLLQVNQGREEEVSNWGFNVLIRKFSRKKGSKKVSIQGKVRNKITNAPISNGLVHIEETDTFTTTDVEGNFSFSGLAQGSYTIKAFKTGFAEFTATGVQVVTGSATTFNIQMLAEADLASVSGTVLKTGVPVNSIVRIVGTTHTATPDNTGYYTIPGIAPGTGIVVEAEVLVPGSPETMQQTIDLEPGEGREVVFNFV